jgi:hypothetical protein
MTAKKSMGKKDAAGGEIVDDSMSGMMMARERRRGLGSVGTSAGGVVRGA